MAVGDRTAPSIDTTYTNPSYMSQHPWDHVEGAPYGTRGGMVVEHAFPADGEYVFEMTFNAGENARFEDIDISIDGERVALLELRDWRRSAAADGRGAGADPHRADPHPRRPAHGVGGVRAPDRGPVRGPDPAARLVVRRRRLGRQRHHHAPAPPRPDRRRAVPGDRRVGHAEPPADLHVPADDRRPTRRRARAQIVTRLGAEAYRRPLTAAEIDRLMPFYERAAAKGGFEAGVTRVARGDPGEPVLHLPPRARAAERAARSTTYRVADVDLASRLSFFLWGTPPDKELLSLADQRQAVSDPRVLEAQAQAHARRSARSDALGTRFAAQWLRLQDIDKVHPDPNFYPNFDEQPRRRRCGARRSCSSTAWCEDDRSLLDLYRADYTFVNERLAQHYGIPGVAGDRVPPGARTRTHRAAACSARAACWCRPRSPTARRRCCAASG